MNFLEKDLETIIWENYERCAEKGLDIDQNFHRFGKKYRQLNLAPYGIADLVFFHYSPAQKAYFVQVVELKKGRIDTAAYQQAKRYQTALLALIRKSKGPNDKTPIYFTTILIGNEVEMSGDFLYVLNTDYSCLAYTYKYDFDGITFEQVGKEWRSTAEANTSANQALIIEFAEHRSACQDGYDLNQELLAEGQEQQVQLHGDWNQVLVITPDGVLVNEDLLASDLYDALEDGAE